MSSILYSDEHLACFNHNRRRTLIEVIDKEEGVFEFEAKNNSIVVVYEGCISFSSGMIRNKKLQAGDMFVIPLFNKNSIAVKECCRLFVFRLDANFTFCDHFSFEKLYDYLDVEKDSINPLKTNSIINTYLTGLEQCLKDGINCFYFSELKIREFLFVLRSYYSKESLAQLFYPILNKDAEFSKMIFENIKKVKTVKELAAIMNYSISGFDKRFKKVFGVSANKWMEEQMVREIYREINCTNKTMMEIAFQYGFSPSYFNDFCKRVFKATPGQIRNGEK